MKRFPDAYLHTTFKGAITILLCGVLLGLVLFPAGICAQGGEDILSQKAPALSKAVSQNPLALQNIEAVRLLNEKVINKYTDIYEPVRFMHRKHAQIIKDCTVCHHRVARVKEDRGGVKVTMQELKRMKKKPTPCSECHSKPFQTKTLARVGLKAAFHRTCIGCHKKTSSAPVGCKQCHGKNVPDHAKLVKFKGSPTPVQVTKECLRCHKKEANDFIHSVHWKWQGFARSTLGAEKRDDLGKKTYCLNNFGISIHGNAEHCASCHPGYGWVKTGSSSTDISKIDCLVCHDSTHKYKRNIEKGGIPVSGIDLAKIASRVGKPDRSNCGSCHFGRDFGGILYHGMMNPRLARSEKLSDVHMGTTFSEMNVRCQYCHKTRNHKIAGLVTRSTPQEGVVRCTRCHSHQPHISGNLLSHHLNQHVRHIACETCHIPVVFKGTSIQIALNWSKVKKGNFKEAASYSQCVKPVYRWFNGKMKRVLLGEKIENPSKSVALNAPVGNFDDPGSKIYPFVIHKAELPIDSVFKYIAVPKIWPDLTEDNDWDSALKAGMKEAGLPYSGKYRFLETEFYSGVHHEVLPVKIALSCANCHQALSEQPACGLCHKPSKNIDFVALAHEAGKFGILVKKGMPVKGLVGSTNYIDFEKLGYKGDPIRYGGRFQKLKIKITREEKDEYGTQGVFPF